MSRQMETSSDTLPALAASPLGIQSGQVMTALKVSGFYTLLFGLFLSPVIFTRFLAPGDGMAYFLPGYLTPKTLWTTGIFSGFPLAADPQMMAWYPLTWLFSLLPRGYNLLALCAYVLAGTFTFYFVRALGCGGFASLAAGIIYPMSGFMMAHLGQTNVIHTVAWLPMLLLGAHRLHQRFSAGWFVVNCLSMGLMFLAGHPQFAFYNLMLWGVYVLFIGGAAEAGRWQYYGIMAGVATWGAALAAIALLPAAQLSHLSIRDKMTFTVFIVPAIPVEQLTTFLFPFLFGGPINSLYPRGYVGAPNFTELAGYAGLLPLLLGLVALCRGHRRFQVRFWTATALISLLLALGDQTPLAWIMFHVPGYNLFRSPSRIVVIFDLALAVLAALGIESVRRDAAGARLQWIKRACLAFGAIFLWTLLAVAARYAYISNLFYEKTKQLDWDWKPWRNTSVGIPVLLALGAVGVVMAWGKWPRTWSRTALMVLLILDLGSFTWFMEWHYLSPTEAQIQCPPGLKKYQPLLADGHHRLVSARGWDTTPDEAKPNLNLLWDLPNTSGYSPLILRRYSVLLSLTAEGKLWNADVWNSPEGGALSPDNRALDILSARYLMGPRGVEPGGGAFARDGFTWSQRMLGIELSHHRGQEPPADVWLAVPNQTASDLALETTLGGSVDVENGTPVLRVTVQTDTGQQEFVLRAGEHTSEWAWDRPDVRAAVRHRRAIIFESFPANGFQRHYYLAVLPLAEAQSIRRIGLHDLAPSGVSVFVSRISLRNTATGGSFQITDRKNTRWEKVDTLPHAIIYENRHLLPRAWLASKTLRLKPKQIVSAIQTSTLPDGTHFDPAQVALVERKIGQPPDGQADPNAHVKITHLAADSVELAVHTDGGRFLVLGDVNYPGWQARIDGEPARIYQTDYILRGVNVPPGDHKVRFVFRPRIVYAGAGISGLALAGLGLLVVADRKRRKKGDGRRLAA